MTNQFDKLTELRQAAIDMALGYFEYGIDDSPVSIARFLQIARDADYLIQTIYLDD